MCAAGDPWVAHQPLLPGGGLCAGGKVRDCEGLCLFGIKHNHNKFNATKYV